LRNIPKILSRFTFLFSFFEISDLMALVVLVSYFGCHGSDSHSMFGLTKKQTDVHREIAAGANAVAAPDVSLFHVTTIPSKFLPKSEGGEGQRLVRRVVVWILGAAAVSGLLIAGSSLLVRSIRDQEAVRIQTSMNIPREQPMAVNKAPEEQTEQAVLVEQTIGSCSFSPASVGKNQVVPLGSYQTTAYTASYFCPAGSVTVQLFQFETAEQFETRTKHLGERYVAYEGRFVQNVNDRSKILWGSGNTLVQISAGSLDVDDESVRSVVDAYAQRFVPNPGLPWPLVDRSQPQTPDERDKKRVSDIKKIQIALEFYKVDQGVYPAVLDIASNPSFAVYLPQIPENPVPGGSPYTYTQKSGGQSYELRFTLEIGAGGFSAGEHIARPQGIVSASQSDDALLPLSSDIDADGLTDIEESLWGTSPTVSDSDADTYPDGEEVKNAYDPTASGVKLESSALVKNYLSSRDGFTVLYPARWSVEEREDRTTLFVSEYREDFFQVLVEQAPSSMTLLDWYRTQFLDYEDRAVNTIVISGTSYAILSPDRLTAYAFSGGKLYVISYTPGMKESLDYQSTFAMFLKTIKFFESPT